MFKLQIDSYADFEIPLKDLQNFVKWLFCPVGDFVSSTDEHVRAYVIDEYMLCCENGYAQEHFDYQGLKNLFAGKINE